MNTTKKHIVLAIALIGGACTVNAAQAEIVIASKQACLDTVQTIENKSLSVQLDAAKFNELIEALVAATDLCQANALGEAQQQLLSAAEIVGLNP